MSQDERGTIRTLTSYKEAMSNLIQEYKGRVVDSPGNNNLLAEFGSVINAVNVAAVLSKMLRNDKPGMRYHMLMNEFRKE
jgi:adenylate cyclase